MKKLIMILILTFSVHGLSLKNDTVWTKVGRVDSSLKITKLGASGGGYVKAANTTGLFSVGSLKVDSASLSDSCKGGAVRADSAKKVMQSKVWNDSFPVDLSKEIRFKQRGHKPIVTFVFDDGKATVYSAIRAVFTAQSEVGVSAIITDSIGQTGFMTWAQVDSLNADGWEIASHSKTHADLRTLSEADLRIELGVSKDTLEAHGYSVSSMVYPYHYQNDKVRRLTSEYYRCARGRLQGDDYNINPKVLETFSLRTCVIDSAPLLSVFKTKIDTIEIDSTWVIFLMHGATTNDVDSIGALIDYIQSKNINIYTMKQAIDSIGSIMRAGDVEISERGFGTALISEDVKNGWFGISCKPAAPFDISNALSFNGACTALLNTTGCFFGSTAGGGVYPFDEYGNLVVTSRTGGRDILFYTANTLRLSLDRLGTSIFTGEVNVGNDNGTRSLNIFGGTSATADAFLSFRNSSPSTERWLFGNNGTGIGTDNSFVIYGGGAYQLVGSPLGGWSVGTYYATVPPVGGIIMPGKLGVTTTAPQSEVDLRGTYTALDGGVTAPICNIISNNSAAQDIGGTIQFGGATGKSTTPYGFAAIKGARGSAAAAYAGYMAFYTTQSNSALIERMRIDSLGKIGIANTAPTKKLDVTGGILADTLIAGTVSISAKDSCTGKGWYGDTVYMAKNLKIGAVPIYANNAAAVAGGLAAGALYRTNGDPDLLCIVH